MDIYNPYIVSIISGLMVYFYNYRSTNKDNKQNKQTNLNYVFLTSIVVFILMNYYNGNSSILEPTLDCKFDD